MLRFIREVVLEPGREGLRAAAHRRWPVSRDDNQLGNVGTSEPIIDAGRPASRGVQMPVASVRHKLAD